MSVKYKLLASSNSLEKIERLVNDYFFSISYEVRRTCDFTNNYYICLNGKPYKEDIYVVIRKGNGRYYFYKKLKGDDNNGVKK